MNFASDPILGSTQNQASIETSINDWAQRLAELQKQKISIQPQPTKTPIWDEIDKVMDNLTESQKNYLNNNEEFAKSYKAVADILQREELRLIRPIVEQSKDGKSALEHHLALIRRLRKGAMQAEEEKTAMWEDYMTNFSDMTFREYMQMKKGDKK
nr:MAG TPA: hypothetical protein [Caudoviricetes sp.]